MKTNKIGVIIVAYNGKKWIANCLDSVFNSDYDNFEVLVVDNASSDGTADFVSSFLSKNGGAPIVVKLEENVGFANGNNIGIKRAFANGCDAVALLNQDTKVESNWLRELSKAAEPDEVGIAQAMMLLGNDTSRLNNLGNAMHYLGFGFVSHYRDSAEKFLNSEPIEIGYASGAAMLIKKEVLDKIGMFDEKFFMYHEDLDLCWRARLAGYKIILATKSIVYHFYEFNRNKKMFYWTERNRLACLLQNYSILTLVKLSPILFIVELMMIVYSLIGGWILLKLKSYVWIISNMRLILSQRKKTQSIRKVSDKEIFKRMESRFLFSEVENPIIKYIASPIVNLYYHFIKIFI